ncbi:MAG: hypothetical protein RBQ97_03945 [Acholeplasma sp.]|nr:hypothetical protein [Acholeplasma sp.]
MPLFIKKLYQMYFSAYIIIMMIFFGLFPQVLKNVDTKSINFIVGYTMAVTLTTVLVFIEANIKKEHIFWWLFKLVIGFIFPVLFLFIDNPSIWVLGISAPLLVLDLYLNRNKQYIFNSNNYYIVYGFYSVSILIPTLLTLMGQSYWYIGSLLIFILLWIEYRVYKRLDNVVEYNKTKGLFSVLLIIAIYLLSIYAKIITDWQTPINYFKNVLLPMFVLFGDLGLIIANKRDIIDIIRVTTTE